MSLFDTHCHLDVEAFDPDRAQVLARCREAGVRRLLLPGVMAPGWDGLLRLCRENPGLYPALGLHPLYLERHREGDIARLERALAEQCVLAVGEIGLDFYHKEADREAQRRLFEAQLAIARDAGLPVVLHVRKAHEQVLASLGRIGVRGGTAHAFNGSLEQARRYIELGFKLGFGGMLTYERSRKLRALAASLPLEALVLETDAPDMSPAAHHGERNSPHYLPEVLAALAGVRDESPEAIAQQTTHNALQVFGLEASAAQLPVLNPEVPSVLS